MKYPFLKKSAKKTRLTPIRKAILQIFEEQKIPLTIAEIQKFLEKKNIFPNKTTLYRQMETLIENNMIESVSIKNAVAHYEKKTSHHHHFICNTCADIICIKDENFEQSTKNLEKFLQKNGFFIQNYHFSLEGKCQKCTA